MQFEQVKKSHLEALNMSLLGTPVDRSSVVFVNDIDAGIHSQKDRESFGMAARRRQKQWRKGISKMQLRKAYLTRVGRRMLGLFEASNVYKVFWERYFEYNKVLKLVKGKKSQI